VLISLAVALLAFVLTWWIVTANPSQPIQNTGAGQGVAPSSPETGPKAGPKAGPETDQKTGSETGPKTGSETDPETGSETGAETGAGDEPEAGETGDGAASPTPATGSSSGRAARQQAEAVEELLAGSSDARSSLPDAIAGATRCDRDAVEAIREITVSRRDQLATAQALSVGALKGGARLKDALVEALDASHDADVAFLAWAGRQVESGCAEPVEGDRDYRRGLDRSEAAQKAKTRFAAAWRPIAEAYGLTLWKPGQI
jgi:hypothetical protein